MRYRLLALFTLSLAACLPGGKGVDWPAVERCATPAGDVLGLVISILTTGTGSVINDDELTQLEAAAGQYGAGAVECAINYFVNRETAPTGRARTDAAIASAVARGDDFLRNVAHHEARP